MNIILFIIGFEPIATSPPSDSLYPPIDHGAPPAVETPDSVGTTAVPIGFEATGKTDNTGLGVPLQGHANVQGLLREKYDIVVCVTVVLSLWNISGLK